MSNRSLRWTNLLTLAALAVLGRLALVAVPGVSLSFLAVAVAGLAYGPRMGAAVGFTSRIAGDVLLSGLNPVFLPMGVVEAGLGFAAGVFGRVVDVGQRTPGAGWFRRGLLAQYALTTTLLYSLVSDALTWLFFTWIVPLPDAANGALLGTLLAQGVLFNVPSILFNTILFPLAVPPILRGLRETGLLPEPGPRSAKSADGPAGASAGSVNR